MVLVMQILSAIPSTLQRRDDFVFGEFLEIRQGVLLLLDALARHDEPRQMLGAAKWHRV
jgi:hypothetical protein